MEEAKQERVAGNKRFYSMSRKSELSDEHWKAGSGAREVVIVCRVETEK